MRESATFEDRRKRPDLDWALGRVLAECGFENDHGNANEKEHDDVGKDERASAVFVNEIREATDVAQSDGVADTSEHIIRL